MTGVLDPKVCFHSSIFRAEINLLILTMSVQIAMNKTIAIYEDDINTEANL